MECSFINFLLSVMLFLFIVRMPDIDNNIPKSIFYSALLFFFFSSILFLRIARISLLYKDFMKKLWSCLIEWKRRGAQSLRCRKALCKIIRRYLCLPISDKIVMKFFLNFIYKLDKIYFLTHDTLPVALSLKKKKFLSLAHDTFPTVFPFFGTWKFFRSFFLSLTHDTLSAVFCPSCYICNVLLKSCEVFVVFIMLHF